MDEALEYFRRSVFENLKNIVRGQVYCQLDSDDKMYIELTHRNVRTVYRIQDLSIKLSKGLTVDDVVRDVKREHYRSLNACFFKKIS